MSGVPTSLLADLRAVPPGGWRLTQGAKKLIGGEWFERVTYKDRFFLGLSVETHDGKLWWHLSMSGAKGVPSWDDFVAAKVAFLGPNVDAVQVIPRASRYVNIAPNCLHVFAPVSGDTGLPDFSWSV